MEPTKFTIRQRLANECTHEEYYHQFVTEEIKKMVLRRFSKEELKEAFETDIHLNSIPLIQWDMLAIYLPIGRKMQECGDYPTKAGGVCIVKQAAKEIINES